MFVEGYEIDYAHVKLVPAGFERRGTCDSEGVGKYYEEYPGFLTTQLGPVMSDLEIQVHPHLEEVRKKLCITDSAEN